MIEWMNNFFGIKSEVSVPTLISLIVFIIGGIINYLFTTIKEFNQRKINRETFILLLNEINRNIKQKEKNISKFLPQINLLNEESIIFTQSSISYLDTIFELDFKEIYYSFRKKFYWSLCNRKLKDKAFHKIWSILRNQKYFEEKILTSVNDFSTLYNSHVTSYYTLLEEYRKYNDELMHEYQGFEHQDTNSKLHEYLDSLDEIWFAWQELGEKRTFHFYSYNKLVLPMLELNRKYSDLITTLKSSTLLLNCQREYSEIENIINSYNKQFTIYHKMYLDKQRLLKKCLLLI